MSYKYSMDHKLKYAALFVLIFFSACSAGPIKPAAPLQSVSLQLNGPAQSRCAGFYVALEKGWYRQEGIDLTIRPGGSGINSIDEVAEGKSLFGVAPLIDLSIAVAKKASVISIGQIQQRNGLLLISKKSAHIKAPGDLTGKRVGIWQDSREVQFKALVAEAKIHLNNVQVVPQESGMGQFLKGDIDAASAMSYSEYLEVLGTGMKPEDLAVMDYNDYHLGFPGDALFTNRKTLRERPDFCLCMLRASLRGWKYAADHPEEAVDIVLKHSKEGPAGRVHELAMMKEISKLVAMPGRPLGRTDDAAARNMLETLIGEGALSGAVNPRDIYTNLFWEQIRSTERPL